MKAVREKIMRMLSVFLIVSVFFSSIALQTVAVAENTPDTAAATENVVSTSSELQSYYDYVKNCGISNKAGDNIDIAISAFAANGADANAGGNGVIWNDGNGTISWNFSVTEAGLYNLRLDWKALNTGFNPNFGIMLDGEYLFEGMDDIVVDRLWRNVSDKPRTDAQGNEYAQEQEEIDDTVSTVICDSEGVIIDPYEFALTAGNHTITFVEPKQGIQIEKISFVAPEVIKSYEELSASYDIKETDADIITIEGENADIKSSGSIIPKSNNSDAGMSPSDAYKTKINYIGGTSWQSSGASLTWNFDVEKSGYYYINMRYKQTDLVNGESWRWLKIDGKTPFAEAKELRFPYGTGWKHYTFADSEETPYFIWLEEGPHTISLEVTIGDQAEYFNRLSELVKLLGDEYIKMVMITSESPDLNRDYELFNQIPDFTETLTYCYDGLNKLADDMSAGLGENVSQAVAAIQNMARVLNNMLRSPYIAQQYVKDYYTNYTSISSWLYDMIKMPLSLDQIQIVPAGKEFNNNNANFFKKLAYGAVRLISSFTSDYSLTNSDASSDKGTVRLWVNWGQDQTAVLNSIIQDSFTAETGINVQLEIVSASLINGILAGNFPDVSLHLSRTEPVNLGIRGALTDISKFEDYEEVLTQFQPGAEEPYSYGGATYALPDTQQFFLMFYRTDIFEQLGLEIPNTWEEFLHCTTIIQRNNMSVYVPYTQIVASTTVNAGIGNLNLYPTLMSQHGLSLYNEDKTATAMTSKEALDVFELWTGLYTDYGILKEADFYNRLRVGVMPLGIAPYGTYVTLYSAAPEIQGRWGIALVPGTENEDGTINRTIAGAGTGCGIIKKSPNQKAAWEFLKWWVSAETQTRYNNNVESILGMIGRTSVSNVEAFNSIAWDAEHLKILNEQWSYVNEIHEVPGSYYLTRAVDQAYWSVVEDGERIKDAVVKWSQAADDEIDRKIREYS